jgi:pilus assembly protein CpaC
MTFPGARFTGAVLALLFSAGACALDAAETQQITVTVGKSYVIETPGDMERVAVATEDIVEAVAITQREVVLNGKAPGETTVLIWQHNGSRLSYDVLVEPSNLRNEALQRRLRADVGDSVQAELDDKIVLLRGEVHSQVEGDKAIAIAAGFGTPVNLMTMTTPAAEPQILLKVRFADVDRSASLSLGANLFSTGAGNTTGGTTTGQFQAPTPGGTITKGTAPNFNLSNALNVFLFRRDLNLGATIEALAAKSLVQILAEPNVLATNGKEASFLAGGEFPFPVVQSSAIGGTNVTIQFREFGIRLAFTPTITPRGTIKLVVAPEVSSLDYANGLTYQGFNIPGLDVRRIKTEIELNDQQSFAIAGLLDNQTTQNLSKVPGLGDIPLLGKLFQSRSVTKNNTELIVVVTPELVQPTAAGAQPGIPMPAEFIQGAPEKLPEGYLHDGREIPRTMQIPFVPTDKTPQAVPPGQTTPAAPASASSMTNAIKDALRRETQ